MKVSHFKIIRYTGCMPIQLLLIVSLVTVSVFTILFYIRFMDERNKNLVIQGKLEPFKRKGYLLTPHEMELFWILQKSSISSDYFIFPQLHLSTLLSVKDEMNDLQGKFDWLNKLFVDFVIFDRKNIQPLMVIELNDSTHMWTNRKARDQFVKDALEKNDIPLLTVNTESWADENNFIDSIVLKLNSKI